jgi:O-methyltransferase
MDFFDSLKKTFRFLGFEVTRYRAKKLHLPDVSTDFVEIYRKVCAYTMTSPERIVSLCEAAKYVQANNIEGDVVECGVWKGGSMMAVAETFLKSGDTSKNLYLFDTFEGMPLPTDNDVDLAGVTAESLLDSEDKAVEEFVWCRATLDVVKDALASIG